MYTAFHDKIIVEMFWCLVEDIARNYYFCTLQEYIYTYTYAHLYLC